MARQNPKQLASGRWQADWRDVTGRRFRKSYRTKDAAQKALRTALDARDRGEVPKPPVPTLKEFLDSHGRRSVRERVDPVTWDGYERNFKLHILPYLGDKPLTSITPPVLQAWVFQLRDDGRGAATIHRTFAALAVVMRVGAALGICNVPSKNGLSLPREESAKFATPTMGDVEALSEAIDPRFSALVIVAGYCGLRQSELFGLRPESIEWDQKKIRVWEKLDRKKNRVAKTKSGRERVVTLPDRVATALREQINVYPCDEWVFHRGGKPIDPSWFRENVWVPAREKAGLPACRWHDLRSASVGIMALVWKWGPKRTQMELGHHSAAFTMDRYGGYWQERDENENERMNAQLMDALRVTRRSGQSQDSGVFGRGVFEAAGQGLEPRLPDPESKQADMTVDLRDLIDHDWNQHE